METADISELSLEAQQLIIKWHATGQHVHIEPPSWDEYYLKLIYEIRKKSRDAQTQCATVITDSQHRPLGFGYNSWIRGIDDSILPNVRPDKYPFMIHGEVNAILNCSLRPENGIAYITGDPCENCLQLLWQAGVKEIVYPKAHKNRTHMQATNPEMQTRIEILTWLMKKGGLVIREVDFTPTEE